VQWRGGLKFLPVMPPADYSIFRSADSSRTEYALADELPNFFYER
jgi:hypothetical protein